MFWQKSLTVVLSLWTTEVHLADENVCGPELTQLFLKLSEYHSGDPGVQNQELPFRDQTRWFEESGNPKEEEKARDIKDEVSHRASKG